MILTRAYISIPLIGVTAAIVFSLIGGAYAVDNSAPVQDALKGDRIAIEIAKTPSLTVEEVNADIGISNLIRIDRD